MQCRPFTYRVRPPIGRRQDQNSRGKSKSNPKLKEGNQTNLDRESRYPKQNSKDYEYASYNPIAYDIANHFCEMTADYHTETPHLLDYSKYPVLAGQPPGDTEVDQLIQDVEKYTLANYISFCSLD